MFNGKMNLVVLVEKLINVLMDDNAHLNRAGIIQEVLNNNIIETS